MAINADFFSLQKTLFNLTHERDTNVFEAVTGFTGFVYLFFCKNGFENLTKVFEPRLKHDLRNTILRGKSVFFVTKKIFFLLKLMLCNALRRDNSNSLRNWFFFSLDTNF